MPDPAPLELRADTVVPGAPEEVHALVADARTRSHWLTELRRVELPDADEPAGPAAAELRSFVGEASLLFHRFVGRADVRHYQPGRLLEEDIVIGARVRSRWLFEPVGDGTRVAHTLLIDFPGGPLGRLERWALGRRLGRLQRQSLTRLEDHVRASGRVE